MAAMLKPRGARLGATPLFLLIEMLVSLSSWAEDPRGASSVFGPGEQLLYEVSYFGMVAGSVRVTVGAETKQSQWSVWPIVMLAQSNALFGFYPVRDRFVTYWDFAAQRTVGNDLFLDENHRRSLQRIRLDHRSKLATISKQREGGAEVLSTLPIETGALDMGAAAFAIRNRALSVGTAVEFTIFTGKKTFVLKVMVESELLIHMPQGDEKAFKTRVQTQFNDKFASKRDMIVYFSVSRGHRPLKVEAEIALGTVTGTLIDYKEGRVAADSSFGS